MSELPNLSKIDRHNLDEMLLSHAYEYQRITEQLPALREAMTRSKEEIEIVSASLYTAIRQQIEADGGKATEALVNAKIKTEAVYKQAFDKWLADRRKYDEAERLQQSFIHQEQAIKSLISLYQSGYWSLSGLERYMPAPQSKDGDSGFREREQIPTHDDLVTGVDKAMDTMATGLPSSVTLPDDMLGSSSIKVPDMTSQTHAPLEQSDKERLEEHDKEILNPPDNSGGTK